MKRIVVVGAGLIGSRHARAVQRHSGCTLVGVVDPNTHLHIDPTVHYFQDMADITVKVDAAIIATPTHLHAAHGIFAAEQGWNLLIEKPVAGSLADADALTKAVERTHVVSLVGHHRRYHPSVRRLKTLVETQEIGQPITSTMIWAMAKPDAYFKGNWRMTDGSPVMINAVHDIDLLRFVFGEVTGIAALGSAHVRNTGRIESGAFILSFASGVTASVSFADTTPSPWGFEAATSENPNIATTKQDMWWITGTTGAVSFPSMTIWRGASDWADAPTAHHLNIETVAPLNAQLDHFLDVIDRKADPLIDVLDAKRSLDVTLQIENALRQAIAA